MWQTACTIGKLDTKMNYKIILKFFINIKKKCLLIILLITKCYVKKNKKPHNFESKIGLKLMIFFHFLAIQTHIQNLQTPQQSINIHKLRLHKLTVHTFPYSLIHNKLNNYRIQTHLQFMKLKLKNTKKFHNKLKKFSCLQAPS